MILSEAQCREAYSLACYRAGFGVPGAQREADSLYTCIALYRHAALRDERPTEDWLLYTVRRIDEDLLDPDIYPADADVPRDVAGLLRAAEWEGVLDDVLAPYKAEYSRRDRFVWHAGDLQVGA